MNIFTQSFANNTFYLHFFFRSLLDVDTFSKSDPGMLDVVYSSESALTH